ncbi:uncharacterized protein LOC120273814 isoform X2 [Dioscorea cayenensis subsp. rotundata]|uniref:Uncharacterized protein LOC120273814 isoform X2 n=1 Tax=Dioscorea cayennensis subsp. rotundata TaxID=55577 RepID=A0AB40CCE2_DIOCR|nr:uncharacterized protein LOC120273814 isoform X2 [Dioscorea cayenensis subsp. rotundata]
MHCPLVFLIFILLVFLFFILLVFLLFNRTSPLHPTPLSGLHFHPSIHPWHLYLDPSGRMRRILSGVDVSIEEIESTVNAILDGNMNAILEQRHSINDLMILILKLKRENTLTIYRTYTGHCLVVGLEAFQVDRTSVDFVLSLLLAAQGNQGVQIK